MRSAGLVEFGSTGCASGAEAIHTFGIGAMQAAFDLLRGIAIDASSDMRFSGRRGIPRIAAGNTKEIHFLTPPE